MSRRAEPHSDKQFRGSSQRRDTASFPGSLVSHLFDGQDQRKNHMLAQSVDAGMLLYSIEGRAAAETYLVLQQVPQHVVLRVLECAAFRRKPAAHAV